jgi:peptidylprolyl isomerase
LISFGVMVVCVLVLVVSQLTQKDTAIAAELPRPEAATILAQTSPRQPSEAAPMSTPEKQPEVQTTASGLQYTDVVEGTGASPEKGQTVTVHYTGTLQNGKKFDSSVDRGQPFKFKIGVGQVIKGWDEGVGTMKVGGRRQLVIPPDLGYGERGIGPIPPNSTLVFDVELLGVS